MLKNLTTFISLVCCLSFARAQPSNILLIIADDFGADSFPLTATGGTLPPMPNITALKNSGVLFSNAYAHPTCSPTRASLLTGRHPFRTGIGAQLVGASSPQLAASEFTLPDAFAANPSLGYSLAMFGKWHLNSGANVNDTPRTIGGWPSFAGTIIGAIPDYSAWTKVTNNVSTASTTYATTDVADDVISFITTRPSGTPWFAWAAFNAPHTPFHVPPAGLHSYGTPTTNRGMYEAACQALDTEVGRILANVNLANTNVIFIGDNGTPQQVIQTPYTAAHSKETIYEGGIRVPLVIAGPAVASPNRTSTTRVHAVDLYSTILEMADINVSATQPGANVIDSRSLMPILKNVATETRSVFSQEFSADLATSISGRAITDHAGYSLLSFDDGREELYNTATDVNQTTNLLGTTISAAAQAAYVSLKTQLASYQIAPVPNDSRISSWFTANSGEYARIYETVAAQNAVIDGSVTTWNRGAGVQTTPTYSDVQQVDYSSNYVYVHTTGLASYTMGPWYLNAEKTTLFPNYPSNTGTTFRIPRVPTIPATKTLTPNGVTGRMVNGVTMFDLRDAFSYINATGLDAGPGGGTNGDGVWNRDAYHNESVTFDAGYAHQAGNNYHNHAQPIALRYQLGDHVDYNATTKTYSESTAPVTKHSPIVGWAADGLPVYGPYGYSNPTNASSGIRRMISGFVLRNGANGTTAISVRQVLPLWAQRIQNKTTLLVNQYGPAVVTGYLLGHYIEDYDFRGDLIPTQTQTTGATIRDYDLNEQNVRFCHTPEFPTGTWAYFTPIETNGTPVMPYTTGRQYYGAPTGGNVTSIAEPVSTSFIGGPFKSDSIGPLALNPANGNVTLSWSGVEGGIYTVEASSNLTNWTPPLATNAVVTGGSIGSYLDAAIGITQDRRFYRTNRTGISAYDKTGFAGTYFTSLLPTGGGPNTVLPNSGAKGAAVPVVIQLDGTTTPLLPPATTIVYSVTFSGTGITATNLTRPSQTLVTATFTIAPNATAGQQNVIVRYRDSTGPSRTLTGAFTVN
jgi:arylsulfatase A-like enzyme